MQHVEATGRGDAHVERMVIKEEQQGHRLDGATKPAQRPEVDIRDWQVQQLEASRRAQQAKSDVQERRVRQSQENTTKRVQEDAERATSTPRRENSRTRAFRVNKRRTRTKDCDIQNRSYSKEMITEQVQQERDHNNPTAIPRGVDTMIQNRRMQHEETNR